MGKVLEDITKVLTFGAASELMKAKDPKKAKKAAPPVTAQDTNVREAAKRKSMQLAAASRNKSKVVSNPGSTFGGSSSPLGY